MSGFSAVKLLPPPLSILSCPFSLINVSVDSLILNIFCSLNYNLILLYFIAQIVPALAFGSFSVGFVLFGIPPSVCVFFGTIPYFLVLQGASGSSSVFPAPVLESDISPRSPDTFIEE